jgi:hypothetical protein
MDRINAEIVQSTTPLGISACVLAVRGISRHKQPSVITIRVFTHRLLKLMTQLSVVGRFITLT